VVKLLSGVKMMASHPDLNIIKQFLDQSDTSRQNLAKLAVLRALANLVRLAKLRDPPRPNQNRTIKRVRGLGAFES
jgi:hypothetical protein